MTATAEKLRGRNVLTHDGVTLGEIADVYLDDETGQAKWVTIEMSRLGHKSLVPLSVATWDEAGVRVPFDKKLIKRAPHANPGVHVSRRLELRVLEHYGLAGGATLAEPGVPATVPSGASGPEADAAEERGSAGLDPTRPDVAPGHVEDRPLSVTA